MKRLSKNQLQSQLSKYFKHECIDRGFRQMTVVALTKGELSQARVSDLWNNKREWSLDSIYHISNVLGLSEQDFIANAKKYSTRIDHTTPR